MTDWKVRFIDYPKHYRSMEGEIDRAIKRVLTQGDLIMRGDMLEFERRMAELLGCHDTVAVANCTDGLLLSLLAAGVGEGDEVITVAHTFVATLEAIVHARAKPVLVDIGEDFVMDVAQVERAITSRTRAIMPVHLNGRLVDMRALSALAEKHNLLVIEDSAQAVGASFEGIRGGAWGLGGCFSFYPAKLLGAFGDGGLVSCKTAEFAAEIRLLRDHGRVGKDTLAKFAYNSRLDNLQAAILNVKLDRVPQWIEQRRALAAVYHRGLKDVKGVGVPPGPTTSGAYHDVYQNYVIKAERRDELVAHLKESGIETIVSNPIPVHHQKGLGLMQFKLPVTERVAGEVVSLPLIPEIEPHQVEYVVGCVRSFYGA